MWRSMALVMTISLGGAPAFAQSSLHAVGVHALETKAALDAASAEKVQAVVDRYKPKMDPLRQEDLRILHEIRGTVDDGQAKSLTAKLSKNRKKLASLKADRLNDIEKLLTPSQFARLLASMSRVDRAVHREAKKLHHS
jgi:Spy/CpxP family protein refolding chaperone